MSFGPILESFILETKKSPSGVKPMAKSPFLNDRTDAFLYQEDIDIYLSRLEEKSFHFKFSELIISCFLETAMHAMMKSPQAKKHAFGAFCSSGSIISCGINKFPTSDEADKAGYPWGAHHAEFDLLLQGEDLSHVSFFVGVRVNRFKEFRCSVPCRYCMKKYAHVKLPIFALDWGGNIVFCLPDGSQKKLCRLPGAQIEK